MAYLDHNATSPLRPEARSAMERAFALSGNPSSVHAAGRAARAAIEDARELIQGRRPVADLTDVYVESVEAFLDGKNL